MSEGGRRREIVRGRSSEEVREREVVRGRSSEGRSSEEGSRGREQREVTGGREGGEGVRVKT